MDKQKEHEQALLQIQVLERAIKDYQANAKNLTDDHQKSPGKPRFFRIKKLKDGKLHAWFLAKEELLINIKSLQGLFRGKRLKTDYWPKNSSNELKPFYDKAFKG